MKAVSHVAKSDATSQSTNMARLHDCFLSVMSDFNRSAPMALVASGGFNLSHYKGYLRQVFHYTRENPQLLACAAGYLRGSDREFVGRFLRHALEEVAHDQWALRDLASLGEDVSRVPIENPLPATLALNGFAYYQITQRNAVSHLGYLYFLEFLPTATGGQYMALLESLGVPRTAMSFLQEHVQVDIKHNQLMSRYADELIRTESDMDAVLYSMRATGKLYANLLQAVIDQEKCSEDWGVSGTEVDRRRDAACP